MTAASVICFTDERAIVAQRDLRTKRSLRQVEYEYHAEPPVLPQTSDELLPLAGSLVSRVREDFPTGLTCRLVIPSSWCFLHDVSLPTPRGNEQAAIYAFERSVPAELERLTCASWPVAPRRALVAGVFPEPFRGLLEHMEREGVFVDGLTTNAALLLNGSRSISDTHNHSGTLLVDARHIVVLGPLAAAGSPADAGSGVRILLVEGAEDARIAHELAVTMSLVSGCRNWRAYRLNEASYFDSCTDALSEWGFSVDSVGPPETVTALLEQGLEGDTGPDLQRDGLASTARWNPLRRQISRCLVALTVLFVALGVHLHLDKRAYTGALRSHRSVRDEIYQSVFPDSEVPPAAALRLRSERIKLEGLTENVPADTASLGFSSMQVLYLLREVTSRVPDDLRLRLDELLVDPKTVRISGKTSSHSEAGRLVKSLNSVPDFAFGPPQTRLLADRTVEFRIHGSRVVDDHKP